jgi:hypothetical protein
MALTYRQTKGSALTIQELDSNFEYFTGSHAVTGSFITSGSLTVIGSTDITGSTNISGLLTITNISGALLTPTASLNGIAPTFQASEGQFLFGSGSDGYKIFVWLDGNWRSGSLF